MTPEEHGTATEAPHEAGAKPAEATAFTMTNTEMVATVATVGVVAVGVAIVEAALIPGLIIGVAATAAPLVLPRLGTSLQPMFRATVRGGYKAARKARHAFAEAKEQVHDIVAEVGAETTEPKV